MCAVQYVYGCCTDGNKSLSGSVPSLPSSSLTGFIWDELQAIEAWRAAWRQGGRVWVQCITSTHMPSHDMSRQTCVSGHIFRRGLQARSRCNKTPDIHKQPGDGASSQSSAAASGTTVFYTINTTGGTSSIFCRWAEQMRNRAQRVTAGSCMAWSQVSASFPP